MLPAGRFSEALLASADARLENRPIVQGDHLIVLPTLGMLVPNWFLVVPSNHTLNFAQQAHVVRATLPIVVDALRDLESVRGQSMIVFEHGPATVGSTVGCGVDHAHVHVLFGDDALIDRTWLSIQSELHAEVEPRSLSGSYELIDPLRSYYYAWRDSQTILEQPASAEISQRFRRIVAAAADMPDQWNYRQYPFHDNIVRTVAAIQRSALAA